MIDVILTTHNRLGLTIACVEALYEWTNAPFTLTVIDDSTDLTPQWFNQFMREHDNVNYMHYAERVLTGGSQIFNIGLKNTSNEYVVNLNNSIKVNPNWLPVALEYINNNPNVGVVGVKLLKPNSCIISHAGMHIVDGTLYNVGSGEPSHEFTHFCEMPAVGFALALIRRSALPNGVDEDYYIGFSGMDDVDTCYDLLKRGWKVLYCGHGSAYHSEGATRMKGTNEVVGKSQENFKRFLVRWGAEAKVP